jgi:nicotinamide N-methyltransferase
LGLILEEREAKPDEQEWLGSFEVSGLDRHALALRKAACRYWIGRWEQQKS